MNTSDQVALYRLLAQALKYPETDFAASLRKATSLLRLDLLDDASLPVAPFVHELGLLGRLQLDQVQGEHTRLFLNAFPRVPCPPYESAYREGELAGRSAEAVHAAYRQWGLVTETEDVDHAGAELEFLAFLMSLEAPEATAAAEDFLAAHVSRWLPQFAADMVRESSLPFYRSTGRLLAALVDNCPSAGGGTGVGHG
jgi:TorA maturation chaperone TorD